MMPTLDQPQLKRALSAFSHASDMPICQVEGYLEQELADDPDVHTYVQTLLSNYCPLPPDSVSSDSTVATPDCWVDLNDRYEFIERLGHGGCGVVFKALDCQANHFVAIKTVSRDGLRPEEFAFYDQLLLKEALSLKAVGTHPNIATCYDIVGGKSPMPEPVNTAIKPGGGPVPHYIVTEFVTGTNLSQVISKAKERSQFVSIARVVKWVTQIANALAYVHKRGFYHCDVTPRNIVITQSDDAILVDFGLAKTPELVRKGAMPGGVEPYMSPEQIGAISRSIDGRSDVYSLGVVFYELLIHKLPIVPADPRIFGAWQAAKRDQSPIPPNETRAREISKEIFGICVKCLSRSPDDRFHAYDLADRLDACVGISVPIPFVGRPDVARSPKPFKPVEGPDFFGYGGFKPTRQEFEQRLVHRPALADEIDRRLDAARWALVRADGAAGKTVLATMIALARAASGAPVYYLTLRDADDSDQILEAIEGLAQTRALLILDDLHHDEGLARRAYDCWTKNASGSQLLLLGRKTSGSAVDGYDRPLGELDAASPLTLVVTPDDLLGVFRRIVARHPDKRWREPPPEAVRDWHTLFGKNLFAFLAAATIATETHRLQKGKWHLDEKDASEYMWDRYIKKLSDRDRHDLITVARLATIEVTTTVRIVHPGALERYRRDGDVELTQRGEHRHYYMHSGLARLILAGARADVTSDTFMTVARQDTFVGLFLARRLEHLSRPHEARDVLLTIHDAPDALLKVAREGLQHLVGNLQRFESLKVCSMADSDAALARGVDALYEVLLTTPPHFVASFLSAAETRLPLLSNRLLELLAIKEKADAIATAVCGRPFLGHFQPFLEYAGDRLPTVHRSLLDALRSAKSHLLEQCYREQPGWVAAFLDCLGRADKALHGDLCQALEDRAPEVARAVCGRPLSELRPFLEYAYSSLPSVHKCLLTVLRNTISALLEQCYREQPGWVAAFLDCLGKADRALHRDLCQALEDRAPEVARAMCGRPLSELHQFLEYAHSSLPGVHQSLLTALRNTMSALLERCYREQPGHVAVFLEHLRKADHALHRDLCQGLKATALIESCLASSLDHLTAFLRYICEEVPDVHSSLCRELDVRLDAFERRCLASSLDCVAAFLGHAERHMAALGTELAGRLSSASAAAALARRACSTHPGQLVSILTHQRLGPSVVSAIDNEEWEQNQRALLPTDASFARGLARVEKLGRPELADAPFSGLIQAANPHHWAQTSITIVHLSQTLRLGASAGLEAKLHFLRAAITPNWIDRQYRSVDRPGGVIAGALWGLWYTQHESILQFFRRPALAVRLTREARACAPPSGTTAFYEFLQLLGICEVLGVTLPRAALARLGPRQVDEALRVSRERLESHFHEARQLWCGLRVFTGLDRRRVQAPPELGSAVLAKWLSAGARTDRERVFNSWMLDWLRRCEAADWTVLPDNTPVGKVEGVPNASIAEFTRSPAACTPTDTSRSFGGP